MTWDPHVPGLKVRLRDNPGRQGMTTGKVKQAGSYLLTEVDFGPTEKQFKRYDLLEMVDAEEDMFDLLASGRLGGPIDLRRIFTFEKIKGDLTNVFYSMEASNTDFYPHQFKPVLKFIESPVGRLLIADEVGLGKTIESIYIWKELQARYDSRRFLVVCPAMLREKWQSDLKTRFNISAEIVDAKHLLKTLTDVSAGRGNHSFVYIISLEAMRPPRGFEDLKKMSPRAGLARILDANTASDEFALLDLVVFDEAHYLRNPSTANNRLGRLLREASHHMVLLTATPIQIASDNLYQLVRLIDPDEFYDSRLFDEILRANEPIVYGLRCLWRQPPDLVGAREAIEQAMSSIYFADDAVLRRISDQVLSVHSDPEKRIELVRMLETRSLLGQYMVRSRKREVLERKVERTPQVLAVRFSDVERRIYNRVTERIRIQCCGRSGVSLFALIARQRQMASSLVAALESWNRQDLLEELLWEDMGRLMPLDEQRAEETDPNGRAVDDILADFEWNTLQEEGESEIDLGGLESVDTKYVKLREFLLEQIEKKNDEKFVIFAFFRGTLQYLSRRLKQDGIPNALIMGGMGDAKYEILREFSQPVGPSVLLSSEVGSEGIDLQFCRFVVNYDLPWNPMRVEQRIGRLDRLGQKADRISIINLAVEDTIEDRILLRLYDRIDLFRESIGDLEEILGERTEQLIVRMFNATLDREEQERNARDAEMAILNRRDEQKRLEQEAVNLMGFSDYIIDHIRESREKGRWLSSDELIALVDDFFSRKYPGTKIETHAKFASAVFIRLSEAARASLGIHVAERRPATRTRLHQSSRPILCLFDPREVHTFGRDVELIEPTHPLIQWIRADYERDERQLHPVSAVRLKVEKAPLATGDYVFVAHRWSFVGLRTDHLLAYRAVRIGERQSLNGSLSEELVTTAAKYGQTFPNAVNVIGDAECLKNGAEICDKTLSEAFGKKMLDFEAENTLRCGQQEISARKFADRRVSELQERLARFRAEGNSQPIPMTEGLIRKEEDQLQTKLARVDQRRLVDPTLVRLAVGIVRVE